MTDEPSILSTEQTTKEQTKEKIIKETTKTLSANKTRKTSISKADKPEEVVTSQDLPLKPIELCELPSTLFPDAKRIRATVQRPDGRQQSAQVISSTKGNSVRFHPSSTGRHRLQIFYEDSLVESYTSVFDVQRQLPQQPYAQGRGLVFGQVGQPCEFQVTTPSDVDHQLTVSFLIKKIRFDGIDCNQTHLFDPSFVNRFPFLDRPMLS